MAGIKLPFVVEPKGSLGSVMVGKDETTGKIEIPVKGYLTAGEKTFAQNALGGDDSTLQIIALSRKIGKDKGITLAEAYQITQDLLGGIVKDEDSDLHLEYNNELSEILTSLALMQDKEKLVAATLLLKYRVNQDIDFEYVMSELHSTIIEDLYELYQAESDGDVEMLQSMMNGGEKEEPSTINEVEKKPSRRRKTATPTE